MIRGTTTPFKIEVPYDTNTISAIYAIFYQKHWKGTEDTGRLPIEKYYKASWVEQEDGSMKLDETHNDGFTFSETNSKEIQTVLSENETLRFSDKEKAYMQIKIQFEFDEGASRVIRASLPQKITVYPVLKDTQIGIPDASETDGGFYIFDAGTIGVGE